MAFIKQPDSLLERLAQIDNDRELYSQFEQAMSMRTVLKPFTPLPSFNITPQMKLPSPEDTKARLKKAAAVVQVLKTAAINHTGKKAFTMSSALQFEIALLNYANVTHKLEFIGKTFENSCVAVSYDVAQKVVTKLRNLHANQQRAYKKLKRCHSLNLAYLIKFTLPDPPPTSPKHYLPCIRVCEEQKYPSLTTHLKYRVYSVA
jgi:hypothetical protein